MPIARKILTEEEARLKMASLCSRSEQCESDIRRKLINLRLTNPQITDIITFLKDEKFLDNARYAKSFVNDKAKFAHWGPYKIKAALASKHILSSLINEAIENLDERIWEQAAMKNAATKARTLDLTLPGDEGYKNRKKLFVFLTGRGFPANLSNRMVKEMKKFQEERNK